MNKHKQAGLYFALFLSLFVASRLAYRGFWLAITDYGSGDVNESFRLFSFTFPFYLTILGTFFLVFATYFLLHPKSRAHAKTNLILHGILMIATCLTSFVFSILKLISGQYHFFLSSMSQFFPLDMMIMDVLLSLIGFTFLRIGLVNPDTYGIVYEKRTCPWFIQVLKAILRSLFTIISLYFIGAFLYIGKTLDRSFRYLEGMIPVYLLMVLPLIAFLFYEFVYRNRKTKVTKHTITTLSVILAVIDLSLLAWIVFYEKSHPNYLVEAGTALFPMDHMLAESLPYGVLIPFLLSLVFAIVSFIYGLFHRLPEKETLTYKTI